MAKKKTTKEEELIVNPWATSARLMEEINKKWKCLPKMNDKYRVLLKFQQVVPDCPEELKNITLLSYEVYDSRAFVNQALALHKNTGLTEFKYFNKTLPLSFFEDFQAGRPVDESQYPDIDLYFGVLTIHSPCNKETISNVFNENFKLRNISGIKSARYISRPLEEIYWESIIDDVQESIDEWYHIQSMISEIKESAIKKLKIAMTGLGE